MNKKMEADKSIKSEAMSPEQTLMFLLQRFNIIKDSNDLATFNGNAFFQAATEHYENQAKEYQLLEEETPPSTSSVTSSSSSSSSAAAAATNYVDPLKNVIENLKKNAQNYDKLLQQCNSVVETLSFSPQLPSPQNPEPPPTPEIAEMLKIFQRNSTKDLAIFNSKLTIKNDEIIIRKFIIKQTSPKKKVGLNGNTIALAEFVNNWIKEKSEPIDCKIYSSNNNGEMQIFGCHRILLEKNSTKLKSNIKTKAFQMDDKNILHIPFFEFPANIVESFLIFCYRGPLNNPQGVYLMAKQLRSASIMNSAIQTLKTNLSIRSVVCQYQFAYENDEFELMEKCVEFIKKQFRYVKYFKQFESLPENVLHELAANVAMSPDLEIF